MHKDAFQGSRVPSSVASLDCAGSCLKGDPLGVPSGRAT